MYDCPCAVADCGLGQLTEQNFLRGFNELHQVLTGEEYARIKEINPDGTGHACAHNSILYTAVL